MYRDSPFGRCVHQEAEAEGIVLTETSHQKKYTTKYYWFSLHLSGVQLIRQKHLFHELIQVMFCRKDIRK